jgi:hypothetical protein
MVVHSYNPNPWEVEAVGAKASLRYIARPRLEKGKINNFINK